MGMSDENIGKTVGRRIGPGDPVKDATILLRTFRRLNKTPLCPKGVWRFNSFEEADEWALKMLVRNQSPEAR